MFQLPQEFPKSLQKYYQILVEEFLHEWRFLVDIQNGRAVPRADFNDKLLEIFKSAGAGLDEIPLPGIGIIHSAVDFMLDWANDKRKESTQEHFTKQQFEVDKSKLRIFIEAAALEVCRRYQYTILMQLTEEDSKGVVPLAKVGVGRMLEYVGRNKLPITVEHLINGLIAGHSGAYVTNYTNTQLIPKKKIKNTLKSQLKNAVGITEFTAEGVYGRSGLMTKDGELYALGDKAKARHKHQQNSSKKLSNLISMSSEDYFDYGYTKFIEDNKDCKDPKYGYMYVSEQVVKQLYGHLDMKEVKQDRALLSKELNEQLDQFLPAIIAIDKKDLEAYLEAKNQKALPSQTGNLLEFIIQRYHPKANGAKYVIYDPANFEDRNLSKLKLDNANLDNCSFLGCIFGGSLENTSFKGSDLRFTDLTPVTSAEGIDLSNAHLECSKAIGLNLTRAILKQTDWSHADLSRANLTGAICFGTIWYKTLLEEIILNEEGKQAISTVQNVQQKQFLELEIKIDALEQKFIEQQDVLNKFLAQAGSQQNEDLKITIQEMQSKLIEMRSAQAAELARIQVIEEVQKGHGQQIQQQAQSIQKLESAMQELGTQANSTHNHIQQQNFINLISEVRQHLNESTSYDSIKKVKSLKKKFKSLESETGSSYDNFNFRYQEDRKLILELKYKFQQDQEQREKYIDKMSHLKMILEKAKKQEKQTAEEIEEYTNAEQKVEYYVREIKRLDESIKKISEEIDKLILKLEKVNEQIKQPLNEESLNSLNKILENFLDSTQKLKEISRTEKGMNLLTRISYAQEDVLEMQLQFSKVTNNFDVKFKAILLVLDQLEFYCLAKQDKLIRTKAKSRAETIFMLIQHLKKVASDSNKGIKDIISAIEDIKGKLETSKLDKRGISEKSSLLFSHLERARKKVMLISLQAQQNSPQSEAQLLISVQRHTSSPLASPVNSRERSVSVRPNSFQINNTGSPQPKML